MDVIEQFQAGGEGHKSSGFDFMIEVAGWDEQERISHMCRY